jgi:hypothetical protein
MHHQPTAVPDEWEAGPVSPVIAGGAWRIHQPCPQAQPEPEPEAV